MQTFRPVLAHVHKCSMMQKFAETNDAVATLGESYKNEDDGVTSIYLNPVIYAITSTFPNWIGSVSYQHQEFQHGWNRRFR